jgi:glycerophosphoryl diester phosphodiesterase
MLRQSDALVPQNRTEPDPDPTNCSLLLACESSRKRKAWWREPQALAQHISQPVITGDSSISLGLAPQALRLRLLSQAKSLNNLRVGTDMTIPRRDFLQLLGTSITTITTPALIPAFNESKPNKEKKKLLIAHRGASSYAPEHTVESYQLALTQGADFVEQDLQITRDAQLICMHDLTLERTTNVKDVFPTRYREEPVGGTATRRWYAADFTLQEIKQLDAGSWFNSRFKSARVPTFQEAIDLIRGKAGLYPETKAPEVYGRLGFDMEQLVVNLLKRNRLGTGSSEKHTPVIIQSFSAESLRKLSGLIKTRIPLVLLIEAEGRTRWLTTEGLTEAKQFASGIGPAKALLDKNLVMQAHALSLSVTPWTFRLTDIGRFKSLREEMSYYLYELGVDAVFTDNPDLFPRTK